MPKSTCVLLCCLLGSSPLLHAEDRPFLDEPGDSVYQDDSEMPWQEGSIVLPEGYRDENLQEFQLDNASGRFRYFIDRSSLQNTADGISRFVLVIRSTSGAENSSYEGLHCGKRKYKVYAIGDSKDMQPVTGSSWQRISKSGRENYRNRLYSDLICNLNTGTPNSPTDVFQAMQKNTIVEYFLFEWD